MDRRRNPCRRSPLTVAIALLVTVVVVTGHAAAAHGQSPRLRFGIYPGGGVGTVHIASGRATADDTELRLAALRGLAGPDRALVMHLYSTWDGAQRVDSLARSLAADIAPYAAAGLEVEPTIRYQPQAAGSGGPAAFAADVRRLVAGLAADRHVVAIQIANEPNVTDAPDAADGAYPGIVRAVVGGVVAARSAVVAAGRRDIGVGMNWAAGAPRAPDRAFWRQLGRRGNRAFRRALGWVGVDIYPGTWSAPRAATGDPRLVRAAIRSALRTLRGHRFRAAHLPRRIRLHISENGFPTGAGRSEAEQAAVMRASVATVKQLRRRHRITDYRWFDLRDAVSGSGLMENEYGIVRDDYSEKAGFAVLRTLIARLGARH